MTNSTLKNAIVYCEGAFNTTNGKTAHGLVRWTRRYHVLTVIDSRYSGQDAGYILDGKYSGILITSSIEEAVNRFRNSPSSPSHLVIGLAPDGGRFSTDALRDIRTAITLGLHIDSGLHDFLSEIPEISELAAQHHVVLRDIRKPPERNMLHFFSGKIEEVDSCTIAVLGTDSAIGKRTTAWILYHALQKMGYSVELIGTGQTAWMQGARYGVIMDSLINDFVSGEIEHAVWSAWHDNKPDIIIVEGQGSLMNPAYPGGFEILAGARPDLILLQHAPMRREYDGFPGYPIQPLAQQIHALELISGKPVVAITINHENLPSEKIDGLCEAIQITTGLPAYDVLVSSAESLVQHLRSLPILSARYPDSPQSSGSNDTPH